MAPKARELTLPFLVVSPGDVARLKREVEALNDYLHQAGLRKGGDETPKLPRTSRLLDELAGANKLELLSSASREQLIEYLGYLSERAPVIAISFASDPSSGFTVKIVAWLHGAINVGNGNAVGFRRGSLLRKNREKAKDCPRSQ